MSITSVDKEIKNEKKQRIEDENFNKRKICIGDCDGSGSSFGSGTSGKSEGSVAAQRIVGEILGANRQRVKTAGILNSSRGAKGGYWIEKSPESLTVKDTLRAVEGEMAPVECLTTVKECGIDCSKCPTRETWGVMWEIILQTMEDVTISDLVKRAMENAGSIKTEYGRMS